MSLWKVALLLNLALVLAAGWGWAWWGRRAAALEVQLATAQARAEALERELAAARTGTSGGAEQQWEVRGIVRAILPEIHVVVLSHDEIPGFMTPMTMGFRAVSPDLYRSVEVGDAVRFTLRGIPPNVALTAIQKSP